MSSAKLTCGAPESERLNKRVLADLCVIATYMTLKTRLPGVRAFRKSRALAKLLTRSSRNDYTSVNSFVEVNNDDLAEVSRVFDVARAFTLERARTAPRRDDDEDESLHHSVLTLEEARRELRKLVEGAVGIRVRPDGGDAFLRRGDAYDCISHTRDGDWSVARGCSEKHFFDQMDDRAEFVILETSSD